MALDARSSAVSTRSTGVLERRLEGIGLHGGRRCAVRFRGVRGPSTLGVAGLHVPLGALAVARVDRATTVRLDAACATCAPSASPASTEIAGVEHLLAAVQGLDAFAGLAIEVEGGEVPLVDGAAAAFADAIEAVCERSERAPAVVVARAELIDVEDARYAFEPLPSTGAESSATSIEVVVAYPPARFGVSLAGEARWSGDRASFLAQLADARTFGARRELEVLRARGLAAHLPAGAVVGLDVDEPGYAPRDAGEPVRHKLLDLLGDLALLGGRFLGGLRATHPSHAATAAALREARARGVFG